jgi:hypothetical protein
MSTFPALQPERTLAVTHVVRNDTVTPVEELFDSSSDTLDDVTDGATYKRILGVVSGQVSPTSIADQAVSTAKFATGIRPVRIVSALPGSGDLQGDTVFLTTDNKLYRWTGSAWVATVPTTDLTGTISSAQIANAAIDTAKFAAGLRPVEIVGALPTAGTQGRTVFLTTDNKLYRDTGAAWTKATDGADIVANSITAGQIQAGAIGTTELAASAVTAAKIAANTITAGQIAADTITGGQIAASAISTSELAARAVSLEKLFVGSFDNLILDPGAEQATTLATDYGWSTNGFGASGGTVSITTASPRSGNQCILFNINGQTAAQDFAANGRAATIAHAVAATEGDTFYFEMWCRKLGTGAAASPYLYMRFMNASGGTITNTVGSPLAPTTTYQKMTLVATAPAGTSFVQFTVEIPSGGVEHLLFDDAYARRMVTGSIVVDGTITATKINVGQLVRDHCRYGNGHSGHH